MTKFYRSDEKFFPHTDQADENILDVLPAGNYTIKQAPMGGPMYFCRLDQAFIPPEKIYGDVMKKVSRVIQTFQDRTGSTGILLSGEKGAGKTLLGKLTIHELAKLGVPAIYVSEPHTSQAFMELIASVSQPCVVMFDEFEKVYNGKSSEEFGHHDQGQVLTLLDGIFSGKKLFILTCNDRYKIDEHMINRPGRLFYNFEFEGLDEGFVTDYCDDKLADKTGIPEVCRITGMFKHFNFDMLQALVEEMNRYGESAKESLKYLNITPTRDYNEYEPQLIPIGAVRPLKNLHPGKLANPLSWGDDEKQLYTYELPASYNRLRGKASPSPTAAGMTVASGNVLDELFADGNSDDDSSYVEFKFTQKDIKLYGQERFELMNSYGEKLILTKQSFTIDWKAL